MTTGAHHRSSLYRTPGIRQVSLALACLAVLSLNGCGDKKKEAAAPPIPVVEVATITPRDVPVSVEYVAQTQSSQQVNIQARVNGFLDRRVYTEGRMVKAGEVLFLMDRKPYQVQVDGATAALALQQASMDTARLNLERIKPLAAKNAVSQKDLDDSRGTYESAAAAVEQAKAQLETAKLNLSYCTITSPIAGITGAAQQQEGTYLNTQNSLLTTVALLSPIWVNFSISENEMKSYRDQIAAGLIRPPRDGNYTVEIVQVDGSLFPHTGRITFAAPSYSAQTGTFLIRVDVANPQGLLRPNQYVRARLQGAIRPHAFLVPQKAVQQGAKGHFLWVISSEGKAAPRPVVVGEWRGEEWFIAEGLKGGEQVVVNGGLTLRPDMSVKVQPLPLPAPQKSTP